MSYAKYYVNDPNAPKPNRPTHLGVNVLLEQDGKLLLEKRRDCDFWGLIGGRVKNSERETHAIQRELFEETGIHLPESAFSKIRVFQDQRIASYTDGSVWKMVVYLYRARVEGNPTLRISAESRELRWFSREELRDLPIIVTHEDMAALF